MRAPRRSRLTCGLIFPPGDGNSYRLFNLVQRGTDIDGDTNNAPNGDEVLDTSDPGLVVLGVVAIEPVCGTTSAMDLGTVFLDAIHFTSPIEAVIIASGEDVTDVVACTRGVEHVRGKGRSKVAGGLIRGWHGVGEIVDDPGGDISLTQVDVSGDFHVANRRFTCTKW